VPKKQLTSEVLIDLHGGRRLARYSNCYGVFVLACSGSLEADSIKKLVEIVYDFLVEASILFFLASGAMTTC
jgi:hypothetical protein